MISWRTFLLLATVSLILPCINLPRASSHNKGQVTPEAEAMHRPGTAEESRSSVWSEVDYLWSNVVHFDPVTFIVLPCAIACAIHIAPTLISFLKSLYHRYCSTSPASLRAAIFDAQAGPGPLPANSSAGHAFPSLTQPVSIDPLVHAIERPTLEVLTPSTGQDTSHDVEQIVAPKISALEERAQSVEQDELREVERTIALASDSGKAELADLKFFIMDFSGWLRSKRLGEWGENLQGLTWYELVALGDAGLESKGIMSLDARRRLTEYFEDVKEIMGVDSDHPTGTNECIFQALLDPISPARLRVPTGPVDHGSGRIQLGKIPWDDLTLLDDIYRWMWLHRIHSYARGFEGMTWAEIIMMDGAQLAAKGVRGIGPRTRFEGMFKVLRFRLGIQHPDNDGTYFDS